MSGGRNGTGASMCRTVAHQQAVKIPVGPDDEERIDAAEANRGGTTSAACRAGAHRGLRPEVPLTAGRTAALGPPDSAPPRPGRASPTALPLRTPARPPPPPVGGGAHQRSPPARHRDQSAGTVHRARRLTAGRRRVVQHRRPVRAARDRCRPRTRDRCCRRRTPALLKPR